MEGKYFQASQELVERKGILIYIKFKPPFEGAAIDVDPVYSGKVNELYRLKLLLAGG